MKSLQLAAIHHMPWLEWRHALADGRVCIRIRTAAEEFDAVTLCHAPKYRDGEPMTRCARTAMTRMWRDEVHEVWEAVIAPEDPRISYCFELHAQGITVLYDADGAQAVPQDRAQIAPFAFAHAYPAKAKPQWARGCVGYQIFPDRFCRVDVPGEEPVEPWGSKRVANEYRFGGNLKGVIRSVPYLHELGVTVVYMTPIFLSDTSHRYNTFDYYTIDPLLGTLDDLRTLADALHERGMRIVLDGVFNHCGLGFAPFKDAMEKGEDSEFRDWFFFGEQYPCGYMTFGEKWQYMPKLNMENPDCAAYFLEVGRYWLREAHVDGWRLDVSPEVYPDFWRQYRKAVLAENPEAILIAECWDDSREWCTTGDMFDGTMHYVLSHAIWKFFAEDAWDLARFDAGINRAMMLYPQAEQNVMWNFLGSHDTARMLTHCGGRVMRMRAAAFFQMTHPGVPIIYYGDELGMRGGPDPDCRRSMMWEKTGSCRMLTYYKKLTHMRNRLRVLREGTFITHEVGGDGVYAYLRVQDGDMALCVLNTADTRVRRTVALPPALAGERKLIDAMSGKTVRPVRGCVTFAAGPGEGMVLVKESAMERAE